MNYIKAKGYNMQTQRQPAQPIWVKLEASTENGHTKIIIERFPMTDLTREQRLQITEKKRLMNDRVRAMRIHRTGFRISESFAV